MTFHLSTMLRLPAVLRSLRMRLTLSYILFFSAILGCGGVLFERALDSMLQQQSELMLEQEWGDVLAYLSQGTTPPTWLPHVNAAGEADVVARIRQCIRIESLDGEVWELSPRFNQLADYNFIDHDEALASPRPILKVKHGAKGETYMVLMGRAHDEGKEFYLAIGVPVRGLLVILQGFVHTYFLALPAVLVIIGFFGWFVARRALVPVEELAAAAGAVSGGHLDVRLAEHGTGDELDKLICTFNSMMERLSQSFEQISQFSVNASHELRTPITAARGNLEVALLSATTVPQYRDAITEAVQDLELLSGLVNELLLLTQAESGQLVLHPKRYNLVSLVENVLSEHHLTAMAKKLRLDAEMPEHHCFAHVDRQQFERMLSNLVSNAVRYTPPGGAVRIALAYGGGIPGDIRLSVSDTGPGIAPEHQPHIFDHLYKIRGVQAGGGGGLGLGLSFALWTARAHGGRIDLKSELGHGSTFTVVLPARLLAPDAPPIGGAAAESLAEAAAVYKVPES
jgi:signal transduction histidine kinase